MPHGGGEPGDEETLEGAARRQLVAQAPGEVGEVGLVVAVEDEMDLGGEAVAQGVARGALLAARAGGAAGESAVATGALAAAGGKVGGGRVGHRRIRIDSIPGRIA